MKKILIVGCDGSGKTTLGRQLSTKLGIPHHQLDFLYFRPGWGAGNFDEFCEKVDQLLEQGAWILDGTYVRNLLVRAQYADAIIFLDMPRLLCMYRVLKRLVVNRIRNTYPPGYPAGVRPAFFSYMMRDYFRRHRPWIMQVLSTIEIIRPECKVYVFTSSRQVKDFVGKVFGDAQVLRNLNVK